MLKLLEAIFIKKKIEKETSKTKIRTIYGIFISVLGIVCNIILSIAKLVIGAISGVISIIADGINNLTDSASSIASLIGFKLASQPADEDHPFGHERIEYITGMIVSLLVLLAGILLGKESIAKIISNEAIDLSNFNIMIGILAGSIVIKCWMGLICKSVGKRIDSLTIQATSQDAFNDCISTGAILIALIVAKIFDIGSFPLDGILGTGVSIFIIINGIKLVKETMNPLIGEAPDKDFVKKIVDKILSYDGVLGIHDLVIHTYGPGKFFVVVHIEVDSKVDVMISHELVDQIEHDFREEFGLELTWHLDPIDTKDAFTLELKEYVREIIDKLKIKYSSKINFHDFRVVKGEHNTNVLFDIINPYDSNIDDEEIVKIVNEMFEERIKNEDISQSMTFKLVLHVDKDFVS